MKTPRLILAAAFLSTLSLQAVNLFAADGPELGLQAYTFRDRTFAETLDRAAAMKIKYIQAYPGQKLSPKNNVKTDHNMDPAAKAEMRALLKAKNLTLTSYGNIMGKDETEWRQIFAFAKEMGLRDIVTEPNPGDFPLIAKLSAETGVAVTIHNHAPPNRYADPETVLAAIKPYGANFGFCADTGHWARTGYDPVAMLRKYAPRIISVHFKDISELGVKTAHDMPWGSGASAAAQQIAELRRQGFKGIAYMEYEIVLPRERLDAEAAASADWFLRAVSAPMPDLIAGRVVPAGFVSENATAQIWSDKQHNAASPRWPAAKPLFAPDLSNATCKPGSWEYKDGVLTAKGGGDIWTNEPYGDFALNLEFRCEAGTNSGVFLRCGDIDNWLHTAIEVQILQGDEPNDKHLVGGIFDISAPSRQVGIEPGRWYQFTIVAKGRKIQVSIDGEQVTDIDLAKWTQAGKNPDGTSNKFKTAYSKMPKEGRIGLQYHGTPISFRNMLVERIDP